MESRLYSEVIALWIYLSELAILPNCPGPMSAMTIKASSLSEATAICPCTKHRPPRERCDAHLCSLMQSESARVSKIDMLSSPLVYLT